MPIYSYKCVYCQFDFDEYRKMNNSGKASCPKCANVAFKVPAIFNAKIFKKREFADGTATPDHVNTPSQEKAWMKAEGIVYDKPIKQKKTKTNMEEAFKKAHDKCQQGYKRRVTDAELKRVTG